MKHKTEAGRPKDIIKMAGFGFCPLLNHLGRYIYLFLYSLFIANLFVFDSSIHASPGIYFLPHPDHRARMGRMLPRSVDGHCLSDLQYTQASLKIF